MRMQRLGINDEGTEEGAENVAVVPRARSVGGVCGGGRRVTPTTGMGASGAATLEVEKALPNGDIYCGEFAGNAPHGRGKYLWADGCMYEGEWRRGKAAGKGKFSWPSGATYEGEFKSGRMDGFGTFIGAEGETYRGSWNADRKHGYGSKSYANGDFFEGQWRKNLQEGQGRYAWRNGNQYVGEWRSGVICGRGVLIWANGNRFDGYWESGVPKGSGVFTWPDGSCYVGTWSNDLRSQLHLNGTFYPAMLAGRRSCSTLVGCSSPSSKKRPSDGIPGKKNLPRICIWDSDGEAGDITCDIFDTIEASMLYKNGDSIGLLRRRSPRNLSTSEVKKPGKTITKGNKNYDLMLNLQLGIRYSVGKPASTQPRELKPCDFDPKEKFWTWFPPEGSKTTPPHHSTEFRWKDYCPMVFRHLRTLFMVDTAEYMLAICGNEALRELSSPGKSGSSFYLTQDDRFMIKTVKKSEVKVLIKMLSSYFKHVNKYRNTLVTKFFGLHCVKPIGGLKVRLVIMGNLFCSEHRIHRRFDLKGSSHGRTIHKSEEEIDENTTLKDLDLNFIFRLQKPWFKKLIWQIEQDCEFLEAEGIMDYSFLVGLHFGDDLSTSSEGSCTTSSQGIPNLYDSFECHESMAEPCLLESTRRVPTKIINDRVQISLGTNMPARAEQVLPDGGLVARPNGGEIFEVILHFGIIDILRDYDISKKLEHAYKSLQVDPTSISAVDPKLYSRRFRDFISRVFVEDD